ncbi:MAG: stalk domain-containing protein [Caldisericia bacterium]|nr:stalk domain-containing protein [Caldisericia bacterium]MDD4614781.1 stalk domain-containing protein [Caldisericia bacterium]
MKNNTSFLLKTCIFIVSFLISLSPLSLFAETNRSWYSLGHGPIAGELGYPIRICTDQSTNILVLDGLKSCIGKYDRFRKLIQAFPVYLPNSDYYAEVELHTSLDNEIYLRVDNFLYTYSSDGSLLHTCQLNTIKGFIGPVGNRIVPIESRKIVFKDQSGGTVWMGSIEENSDIARELTDENGDPIAAIDITVSKDAIYILQAPYGDLRNSHASIYQFSLDGSYVKHTELSELSHFPTHISCHPDGYIALFSTPSYFFILQPNTFSILNEGQYISTNTTMFQNDLDFCSFSQQEILICHPNKGIELIGTDTSSVLIPVCPSKTMSPYRITGDKINIFTFHLLSSTISYYHNDTLKASVPLSQIQSLANVSNFSSDVQLFIDSEDSLFIVIKGIQLSIIHYNMGENQASVVKIPSYIPPKSSIYYRSSDQTFFVLSWFDGILYSFDKKGENITKLEIISLKNQSSFTHQCSISVDDAGFLYILLPTFRKVRVVDTKGYLVVEFSLPMDGVYSDMHLAGSIVSILNSTNGTVYFCTKRGEELFSVGENGAVLYPASIEGYQEKKGSLNYPGDIWGTEDYVYIADTGNSRIQIVSLKSSDSQPKERTTIVLQIGSKSAYIDNERVDLDEPPFTENGRTLVPFRFIGEALNAEIVWDSKQKKASYILDGNRVDVILGSNTAYVNDEPVTLDVPPMIKNGRTFVPIRFVTEALGASVIWEANTKKIYITYPGQ